MDQSARPFVPANWLVSCVVATILTIAAPAGAQSSFTTFGGPIGPGAEYEIAMPTGAWNGELVVYAHGIADPAGPVSATPPVLIQTLRDTLTSQGFALIYSSFSVNGYGAVKDGMQRTHQLRGMFTSRVGQPTRVYLVGTSLGGLISVMLAERFPEQYDGVVSVSGLLGGGVAELKYVGDARVIFDYFFPGVVPGSGFYVPEGVNFNAGGPTYNAVLNTLTLGLSSPGQPTRQFAAAAQLPFKNVTELIKAAMNVIGFGVIYGNDLMDVVHGHMPYDNSETVYSGSADDAALNAGVARFMADPSAANYMEHYYTPTGDLRIPVITLHNSRDPIVPIFHEQLYAAAVQNAGAADFLLQRTVDGFGHADTFPFAQLEAAFFALRDWALTGVKPAQ